MSGKESNPPTFAIWWLQHACPGGDNVALTGDLIERFREGQTRGWFWRQVLIAFAVSVLGEIRRHWPHLSYAIAGAALPEIFFNGVKTVPLKLHWWTLPWPLSQLIFELSTGVLLAFLALPVLAAGLVISGTFRWVGLLRTALINLALLTIGHYWIDFFPSLLRQAPGDPYHKFLIIPPLVQVLLFFSSFLVAAWVGCIAPQQAPRGAAGCTK